MDQRLLDAAKKYKSLTEWAKNDRVTYQMALDMECHRKIGEHLGWNMQKRCKQKQKPTNDADFEIAKFLIQHNAPRPLVVYAMEKLK
jgi:hypothetical protein